MVKMTFNQEEWENFLIENGVVGFEPKTLKSGRTTFWYANFRTLLDDLKKVDKVAEYVYDFCSLQNCCLAHKIYPTSFFAVPEGPREFSSSLNRLLEDKHPGIVIPAVNLRAGYKTHGGVQDRYSVGPVSSQMRPALLEDVGTTGSSVTEYVMLMQELRISPIAVISMLNRCEKRDYPDGRTVQQVLSQDYNVLYLVMADASSILPKAVKILKPPKNIIYGLREELKDMERYAIEIKI
jgi:orotate phosphoribosyltransferase